MNICHVTSVHPLDDVRIVRKEVHSLVEAGHDVTVVGTQGRTDPSSGARFVEVTQTVASRPARMSLHAWRVVRAARRVGADIYHLHDPELLPWVSFLRAKGAKVVYDAHEDLAAQVLSKRYLSPAARRIMSVASGRMVRHFTARADAVVSATPDIARAFRRPLDTVICNFPRQSDIALEQEAPYAGRQPRVAYIGALARPRGIVELVAAMGHVGSDATLDLAGRFKDKALEQECRALPGWANVAFHGWQDRAGVGRILTGARIGAVVLHPTPAYLTSLPVKLFEYMLAGLPVIASDFPFWREIVDGCGCGLLVDPLDTAATARAIDWLLAHPEEAEAMGERGREAVKARYNWENEAGKLVGLYEKLLGQDAR